ncbi:MAG: hypothetical protein RR543_05280 [Erysipelotrichales bacterium]
MKKNILIGLSLIAIGVLLLLSNFGYIQEFSVSRLITILILATIFISSLFHLEFLGVTLSSGVGAIIFKDDLDLEFLNNGTIIIVALLIGVGLNMLFNGPRRKLKNRRYYKHVHGKDQYSHYYEFSDTKVKDEDSNIIDVEESNDNNETSNERRNNINEKEVHYSSSLGEATKFVKSDNLERGYFKNNMGSLSIYLDEVELSKNGAIIEVNNSLGSTKLYIPRRFNLINNLDCMLGEVKEHQYSTVDKTKENTIELVGGVTLGEIEIIRV